MKKKNNLRHRIVINMPYPLLETLIRNRALSLYISNLISDRKINTRYENNITEFFSIKPISRILICSFSWNNTKEGYVFWADIYNELCDKCGSQ
jgi:hypothetical protein